jgi:uncharacterized membrane protein
MRYSSIDVLRTLSILIMVLVHFCENLAGVTPKLVGIGAPMFMFLSGVSYCLWLNGRKTRQLSHDSVSKITARRGLFLIGLGFLFNIVVWMPEDVFNWDVLTLIGTGMVCMGVVRFAPPPLIWLACGMLFLLSPVARELADWESYWPEGYYDPDFTLHDLLQGYFAVGYFPIFPWLLFPLLGFSIAKVAFSEKSGQPNHAALWRIGILGFLLMLLAGAAVAVRFFFSDLFPATWPNSWTMFPPSLEYTTGTTGWNLFAFSTCYWLFDLTLPSEKLKRVRKLTEQFSRRSLTVYLLHHVVHLWPLWIYAVWQGQEPTVYWRQATDLGTALILAAIFILGCAMLFTWLDRRKYPSVENLMRWLCD